MLWNQNTSIYQIVQSLKEPHFPLRCLPFKDHYCSFCSSLGQYNKPPQSPVKQSEPQHGVSSFVGAWPLYNAMLSLHLDWLNHATHLHFPSDLPCSLQTHAFLNPECCPRIEGALLKSHSDVRTDFSTHCCTQESVNCEHMLFLYICLVSCFMAWARASAFLEKGECLRPTRYVLCCTGMLSL